MKAFFVGLVLALPTALAATFQECACTNGSGKQRIASCLAASGAADGFGDNQWCYPATTRTPRMETLFTDSYCASAYGSSFPKAQCRSVQLCQNGDYYKLC